MRAKGVRMKKTLAPILGITLLVSGAAVFAADEAGEAFTDKESAVTENEQAAPAASMEAEDPIAQMFKKLDANQDGMIDKTEAKSDANLSKSFKKIAKNGKLDKNGYQQWEQSRNTNKAPKG